jgi:multiple sugar transport system permease protein
MTQLTGRGHKSISYAKWGYIFLIPFFAVFCVFTLIPLFNTFYLSFFENYMSGLKEIGPKWVGLGNYVKLITESDLPKYLWNTLYLWILGFIPQICIALVLAVWFTDLNLKLKGQGFFKTVIYMPNLIMASAFAMLIFALFSDSGPINNILSSLGLTPYRFMASVSGTRGLIAMVNFLMWFGNTTIVLMAAVMGIDTSMFEAAEIDGANAWQSFWKVTMPLIKPILAYVMITALIGGLQMFDVPQVLTNGKGSPDRTSLTLIMFLNNHLTSKNYGLGGALSVLLFVVTGILSLLVYRSVTHDARESKRLWKGDVK